MANNRIYYAIQQVKLGEGSNKTAIKGLQSVGITTNFNLEQVFEMGQLSLYQNVEEIPEIEVSLSKVLDGTPLIYGLASTKGTTLGNFVASGNKLAERQNARVDVELSIYPDTNTSASGNAFSVLTCKGMYVNSISYAFPVDGNATEDVTLVGNDKIWGGSASGDFTSEESPGTSDKSVTRRNHLDMNTSRFPTEIPGINNSGVNVLIGGGSGHAVHFQNITVSCDLGRETILELGTRAPYFRYATFPVEVTSEFEIIAVSGDGINATESGYWTGNSSYGGNATVAVASDTGCNAARFNLRDQYISIDTCHGVTVDLGTKNKLTSVNYTGGDTGGGNVTVTYSYSNFNDFTVTG